jgi:hypothetical protein
MKRTVLNLAVLFLVLIQAQRCFSQQKINWGELSKVTWHSAYVPSLKGTYKLPKFSKSVLALDGKVVFIIGFYVPINIEAKMFALSANPSSMCFFCNGAGPESVMEIWTKDNQMYFKHLRTDKYIELKGLLKINKGDPNHMMYILKQAEFVREVE